MNTLLSSVLLAIFAMAAAPGALATSVNGRASNFSSTCTKISFNSANNSLTATCELSGNTGTETTTIPLNACVGNDNGELAAGSNFSTSCGNISFSGVTLSATCENPTGNLIHTSIDLNSVLSNNNGVLHCGV
ncbi:Cyanovirin-N [Mycena leptocephala]|nr:Cyanovirin-N [Mycena leptocephala]